MRGEGRQVLILDSGKAILFSDSGCGAARGGESCFLINRGGAKHSCYTKMLLGSFKNKGYVSI